MTIKHVFPVLFLILLTYHCIGKNDSLQHSTCRFFAADTAAFKRGFSLSLDNRNSFIKNRPVNIYGIALEYKWTKNIQYGLGFFMINRDHYTAKKNELNQKPIPDLRLLYATPNIQFVLLYTKRFELEIPLELGLGYATFSLHDPLSTRIIEGHTWFIPSELGLSGLYKLNRWIGFNVAFGYRQILWQSKDKVAIRGKEEIKGKMNLDFDGIYYKLGMKLFIGNIIQDIRDGRKKKG